LHLKQGHYFGGKVAFDFVQVLIIGCTAPGHGIYDSTQYMKISGTFFSTWKFPHVLDDLQKNECKT